MKKKHFIFILVLLIISILSYISVKYILHVIEIEKLKNGNTKGYSIREGTIYQISNEYIYVQKPYKQILFVKKDSTNGFILYDVNGNVLNPSELKVGDKVFSDFPDPKTIRKRVEGIVKSIDDFYCHVLFTFYKRYYFSIEDVVFCNSNSDEIKLSDLKIGNNLYIIYHDDREIIHSIASDPEYIINVKLVKVSDDELSN